MPREHQIITPENVEITHILAGVGSRMIAVAIDHLLQALLMLLAFLGAMSLVGGTQSIGNWITRDVELGPWVLAAVIGVEFTLFWGYFLLFETLRNGQTPGKRIVCIRVVRRDGRPIDFFSSAIRNIVRLIDFLPGTYAVGVFAVFLSPSYQRVGDILAGTVVVREPTEPFSSRQPKPGSKAGSAKEGVGGIDRPVSLHDGVVDRLSDVGIAGAVPEDDLADVLEDVVLEAVRRLTREEYETARRYLNRRNELPPSVSELMARRITLSILERHELRPDDVERYPFARFLERLTEEYLRSHDRYR